MSYGRQPVALADVLAEGDLRTQLVALRDYLADALESCHTSRDQAPLAAQLRQVLLDLDTIPVGEEESTVDELSRARELRRATAAASARPAA